MGTAALLIVMEIIEGGTWRKLGIPLMFLALAIINLIRLQTMERHLAPSATEAGREA